MAAPLNSYVGLGERMNLHGELRFISKRLQEAAVSVDANHSNATSNGLHNSPAWLVGHCTFILNELVLKTLGETLELQCDYGHSFGFGSKKTETLPISYEQIVNDFSAIANATVAALASVNPDDLIKENASPDSFKSNHDLVVHVLQDISYHTGQLRFFNMLYTGQTAASGKV